MNMILMITCRYNGTGFFTNICMLYTYISYICIFINNLLRSSGRCSASLADDDDDDDASKSTGRTIIRLDGNLF